MAAHHLPIRTSAVMLWFEELGQKMKKAVKSLYCCSDVCVVSGDFNHNRSAMKKKALAQGPLSMWDHFDKIAEIGLKPALLEKH